MNPVRETMSYVDDAKEKGRMKFHSVLGVPIPRTKKELHRLHAIMRKID